MGLSESLHCAHSASSSPPLSARSQERQTRGRTSASTSSATRRAAVIILWTESILHRRAHHLQWRLHAEEAFERRGALRDQHAAPVRRP